MDDFNQIVRCLEAFTNPDNEIRNNMEQQYQDFEKQNPEEAIQILFKIITENVSINCVKQALFRLRLFLQNSVSATPIISLDVSGNIRNFLLEFIKNSKSQDSIEYSLSVVLDYHFSLSSNKEMLSDFIHFLIDLYAKQPYLSLNSLTKVYDIYPNQIDDFSSIIFSFMKFEQEGDLFTQSLISGLILIKHKFMFEGCDKFLGSFTQMLSCIPDKDLKNPLKEFSKVFRFSPEVFTPFLEDIFKYILNTIADSDRSQFVRVQCMYMVSEFVTYNSDVRDLIVSNPNIITSVIASAVSQPNKFIDIYYEAKISLKNILMASMDDIQVFGDSLKEFGLSENIYVRSVFLYHIESEISLNFAFENVLSDDQIIRQNCLEIIPRMINADYETRKDDGPSLRDKIEENVVDIFVEYLTRENYEIFDFFKSWCQCKGSKSFYKCIDPIVDLLNKRCFNEQVLMMASLLCKLYNDNQTMQEVASNLLEISKNFIEEQKDEDFFLEIISNILPILDKESKTNYLDEIFPYILKSVKLCVSSDFFRIIEDLDQDFIPYLPDYLNVLYQVASNNYTKEIHVANISDDKNSVGIIFNTDKAIVIDISYVNILDRMLQSFSALIPLFTEFCRTNEIFFRNIINIINQYILFPYDDNVQASAIELCANFLAKYANDQELDIVSIFINSILKGIQRTMDIQNLSLFASVANEMVSNFKPEYGKYIELVIPLIFSNFYQVIQTIEQENRYIDNDDLEYIDELLNGLSKSYELMFDEDVQVAAKLFEEITKIVPYFNLPNLIIQIQKFISIVWVDFMSFAPPEYLPATPPDLLNDLFEFYKINDGNISIQEYIIIEIGTLVYNYSPENAPPVLDKFENIISDENGEEDEYDDISFKQKVAIQCALLLTKCDKDLFDTKFSDIMQMAQLFNSESENIGKFCASLIKIAIFTIKNNCDNQIIQKIIEVISSFINQNFLENDDFEDIINECGDFEAMQPFKLSIQKYLEDENKEEEEESDDNNDN